MKKVGRILAICVLLAVTIAGIYFVLSDEEVPVGTSEKEADVLAQKMMEALNYDKWKETKWVHWNFLGKRTYDWDVERNLVVVKWDDHKVHLDTDELTKSKAYSQSADTSDEGGEMMIEDAWSYFCNDSFWLIAPFKAFDSGTDRSIVLEEKKELLKVQYTSGGVTPGDTYLWYLDENDRPYSYKIWASILPIGGTEITWENWIETKTGVLISGTHKLTIGEISLTEIKTGYTYQDIGLEYDPFVDMN